MAKILRGKPGRLSLSLGGGRFEGVEAAVLAFADSDILVLI
jgi:hypothetical protein